MRNTGPLTALLLAIALADASPASAIYISPFPYTNTFDLGGNTPAATYPFLGIWGNNSGPGGAFKGTCSGVLVEGGPGKTFVLTAGHCIKELPAGAKFQFRINGTGTPLTFEAANVKQHPDYVGATGTDLAIAMIDGGKNPSIPLARGKVQLQVGTTLYAAGFGNTGVVSGKQTGFGTKRHGFFEIGSFGTDLFNRPNGTFRMPLAGTGGATPNGTDPVRQTCKGDSGGAAIRDDKFLIGLVVGGFGGCDGSGNGGVVVDLTRSAAYKFIDGYVGENIFWDRLKLDQGGAVGRLDSFEPAVPALRDAGEYARGDLGLADGWRLLGPGQSIAHPTLGLVGANGLGWEYFNALGMIAQPSIGPGDEDDPDALLSLGLPDLFTDGESSQGATLELGGRSVIFRDFEVVGGSALHVSLDRRWSSLAIGGDIGIGLRDGRIVWRGLEHASLGDLDAWQTLAFDVDLSGFAGPQSVRVYLLAEAAAVSQPPAALLVGAALVFAAATARWRRARTRLSRTGCAGPASRRADRRRG